jgi:membrane protease YdiL (CAAX protease family)
MLSRLLVPIVLVASLWVWARIASKLWRHEPILPRQWQKPVPWDGIDVVMIVAAYIVAVIFCDFIAMRTFGIHGPIDPNRSDPQFHLALLAGNVAASVEIFVIALCILRLRSGATLPQMGFDLRYVSDDVATGFAAFLAAAPLVYGIQWILTDWLQISYEHPLIKAAGESENGLTLGLVTLSAVVVAPIVEEYLFRVVFQGWLEKLELRLTHQLPESTVSGVPLLDDRPISLPINADDILVPAKARGFYGLPLGMIPIVLSSALFAVAHVGWGQGAAAVPLFVFALVLGFLFQRTHRFMPSMVAHMSLNGLSMLAFFAGQFGFW